MATQLQSVAQAVRALREQLLAGQLFQQLPAALDHLMASVAVEPATPVALPDDDLAALAKMHTIRQRVKKTATPSVSDDELTFLVAHLASRSPAVRDKGAFFLLSDLFQMDAFTAAQVSWLFNTLKQPDILFAHIMEPQNDAVFQRSFAVMLLSGLVYADQNRYHALSSKQYSGLLQRLCVYVLLERDGRGYVDGGGWAHAYTHIGNLADELTQVTGLARGEKIFLMASILAGWQRMTVPLVYGEDQRIAAYLVNLAVKHQFYADSLVMCLTAWQTRLHDVRPQENINFWNAWYNRSRLLEALLMRGDLPKVVVDYLQKIIDLY